MKKFKNIKLCNEKHECQFKLMLAEYGLKRLAAATKSRHFSHVTKNRIFKILNWRKKADSNFRCTFLENRFRHLKLYSEPPSWLARSCCHMETFWEAKDQSSHFLESQLFRFWYVEIHHQRKLKSTKTGISSSF